MASPSNRPEASNPADTYASDAGLLVLPSDYHQYFQNCQNEEVVATVTNCKLFKLFEEGDTRKKSVITLLVTRATSFRVPSLIELKELCKELSLKPLDRKSYLQDGVELIAVLFSPFKPLREHMASSTFDNSGFVKVVKGILSDMVNLYTQGLKPCWEIDDDIMVVQDELKTGGILHISSVKDVESVAKDSDRINNFLNVKNTILKYDTGAKTVCSSSLLNLFDCIDKAKTIAQHKRLLHSPYLLSSVDKVFVMIPWLDHAAKLCKLYSNAIDQHFLYKLDWMAQVRQLNDKTLNSLLSYVDPRTGKRNRYSGAASGFLHYLRNGVEHLNAHQKKVGQGGLSPMLKDPNNFLGFINSVKQDFLEEIFLLTYSVIDKTMVPALEAKYTAWTDDV